MYAALTFFSDYLLPGIIFLPSVCLAGHNDLGTRRYFGVKKSLGKDTEGCETMLKELKAVGTSFSCFFLVMFLWPVRLNCTHLGMEGMSFHAGS